MGERGTAATAALIRAAYRVSLPDRVVSVVDPGTELPSSHPAHGKDAIDGRATAYVCVGTVCSLPVTEPAALIGVLPGPDAAR